MLPASKNYLQVGGYSPKAAAFMQIGLFLVGVFGIRLLSQVLHKFIPSHVVDCDHTHDEEAAKHHHEDVSEDEMDESHGQKHGNNTAETDASHTRETTPLLSGTSIPRPSLATTTTAPVGSLQKLSQSNGAVTAPGSRRPSSAFPRSLSRTFTRIVSSKKDECDENGPCMGFSDPCGQHCFKAVQKRGSLPHSHSQQRTPTWQRLPSNFRVPGPVLEESTVEETDITSDCCKQQKKQSSESNPRFLRDGPRSTSATHHYHHPEHEHQHPDRPKQRHNSSHRRPSHSHNHGGTTDHHHHVPTNAFMSIGLQTSIAIALHKAPEGFITFATNHANPKLGFTIFVALFIHNITEGFALSLPLFLALNSRFKAIFWASVLGGLSQPFGAGVAALWFKVSRSSGHLAPNEKVYGGIFAVTAGIMASVGLSLLSESLQLSHNKNTCITFAFVGMGILGISMALTAS